MLIYLGFRLILGKRVRIPYFSVTALSLWLFGLLLALIVAGNTGLDFRHTARINKSYEIQMPEKQILYFDILPDSRIDSRTGKFDVFDGEYSAMIEENGVVIFDVPEVDFSRSVTNHATVSMSAYAKGSSRQKAEQRARGLEYEISSTDTSFSLSNYYLFPPNAVIRAQEVQLEIEIPEGQIIHFDQNMEDFFDENPNWRLRNKGYEGKTWIMTRNGLKPYVEGMELEEPAEPEDEGSIIEMPRHLSMIPVPLIGL